MRDLAQAMKRTLTRDEARTKRKRLRAVDGQQKAANARAKYGPTGKPALVTVRTLAGERTMDQSALVGRRCATTVELAAERAGWPSYEAFLQSAHWRRLRQLVLARDGFCCRRCGRKRGLHVHHDRYDVALDSDAIGHLKTFCERCHRAIHR